MNQNQSVLHEAEAPEKKDLTLHTRDGRVLMATYYAPAHSRNVAVLINSATGVPRRFYDPFAQYLAARGLAVLTYDYRGVGDSHEATGGTEAWGRYDQVAAIEQLSRLRPDDALTIVGHSIGGQLLGLADNIDQVKAAFLVASQSGYWRHWRWPGKARMWLLWWVLMPGLAKLLGHFPGARLGLANLPAAVALNWSRWGRSPYYICDERGAPLRPYNHHVAFPIRWLSFTDDHIAPFEAVEALRSYYPRARQERMHLAPADLGASTMGHFGFFRKTTPPANWSMTVDWLIHHGHRPPA